jgi:hypothetical protein
MAPLTGSDALQYHFAGPQCDGRATNRKNAEEKAEKGLDSASYKLYYVNLQIRIGWTVDGYEPTS